MDSWRGPQVASSPVPEQARARGLELAQAPVRARERSAPATSSRTRPGRREKGVASPDSGIAEPLQTQALLALDRCNRAMTLTLLPCASAQRAFIALCGVRAVAGL